MPDDQDLNWLEKVWGYVSHITKINDDDHWLVVAFKWSLLALIIGTSIILSPVIIIVLVFAFLISL